jgi:hypothetical protein
MSGLSVNGNLVIQPNIVSSKTNPSVAQTFTMNNTSAVQSSATRDSVGRVFDPGGQNVNYFNNMQGNYIIGSSNEINETGIILNFNATDFGLSVGDTLWISHTLFPSCRTDYELMLTNTFTAPSSINISGYGATIIFRSNGDGVNNKGFDISWKKVYKDNAVVNIPSYGFGNALVFNTQDGSFRAGSSPNRNLGISAACIGCKNAEGDNSFATNGAYALGYNSIAMLSGYAGGYKSFAAGINTFAYGNYSFAISSGSQAHGENSTSIGGGRSYGNQANAIGYSTNALSYGSTALGYNNDTLIGTNKIAWVNTDPLLYIGNGINLRSNAMVIYKNANVDINGFTRLGKLSDGAPVIKMKEITLTSAATSTGQSYINHGLNASKIISVNTLLEWTPGYFAPPEYSSDPLLRYNYFVSPTQIFIQNNATTCAYICSKTVKVLITYKE